MNRNKFRYNMSIYYQSTIVYLIVFILYIVIRVLDSSYEITRDPIIFFFAFILVVAIISMLYNLYKNKHLEITDKGLQFVTRFRTKFIPYENIIHIKMFRERGRDKNMPFRLVSIKLKNRKRPLLFRPYDYENQQELINVLREIKTTKNL